MSEKLNLSDRIFVAGAYGMTGSAICRKLYKYGYGDKNNGGEIIRTKRNELNLLDYSAVNNWFQENNPDVVIICAGKVGGIYANKTQPADFLLENLKIQTNLIELSWKFKVRKLLFIASSSIYPKGVSQPIKEEYLLNGVLEKTNQFYSISKIAGIKLCEALRLQYKFDAICVIPSNLYGPCDNYSSKNSHVMAALIRKFSDAVINSRKSVFCWGTGKPLREFLHVDDFAEACIFLLEQNNLNIKSKEEDNQNLIINVGLGEDISIFNLAEKIANYLNFKGDIIWDNSKPDGIIKKQLDISKLKNLGWEAKIGINEGIENTINEYYKELKDGTIRIDNNQETS